MKKIIIVLLILFQVSIINTQATSGKLQSDSICTGADGVTYGKHSQDDPHWHVAENHGESGWYPVGSPVGDNPCAVPEPAYTEPAVVEEPYVSEQVVEETPEPVVVNEAPTITTSVNTYTINIDDMTNDELGTEDLVELFGVKYSDNEDSKEKLVIKSSPEKITASHVGKTTEIEFVVTDSAGKSASTTVSIYVEPHINIEPIITGPTEDIVLTSMPTPEDIINSGKFSCEDLEDGTIVLTVDNIEITDTSIIIEVEDSDGGIAREEFTYIVERNGDVIIALFTIATCVIVGMLIYLSRK